MGVSQSMISRAFNPDASISPVMREKVFEAAKAIGYQPNVIASSLSRRRSNIIGIVMGDMANPFYPDVLSRLARRLQDNGRQCLLFNVPPGEDIEKQLTPLRHYSVDAVVIASATISSSTALSWCTDGRTGVLFNRTVPNVPIDSVSCDNSAGARAIAEHFLGKGSGASPLPPAARTLRPTSIASAASSSAWRSSGCCCMRGPRVENTPSKADAARRWN
jgi:DNA-binding LacI/PurR family transcriptional regulator